MMNGGNPSQLSFNVLQCDLFIEFNYLPGVTEARDNYVFSVVSTLLPHKHRTTFGSTNPTGGTRHDSSGFKVPCGMYSCIGQLAAGGDILQTTQSLKLKDIPRAPYYR